MLSDGEQLRELAQSATERVLLCAPFIKERVLCIILSEIREDVFVRIVTRWRAVEVAAGVSDLEVFELAKERPRTELALLNDLHAKLYLADDRGLAGSANLTAAALGWSENNNLELLISVKQSDPDVAHLLRRLERANLATYTMRSVVAAEAATLSTAQLDEGQELIENSDLTRNQAWLPSCAAPDKLLSIYENPRTSSVVEGTREDGLADLRDLHIPSDISRHEFAGDVREALLLMPAFRRIIELIPLGITDSNGIDLILELYPGTIHSQASLRWRIVRDWIGEFFQEEFEVAPESFLIRLR